MNRPEQAEVLVGRRDDLVLRPEPEPGEDDVATVRRRGGERDLLRLGSDDRGQRLSQLRSPLERPVEPGLAGPPLGEVACLFGLHRIDRRSRERPERSRVQIGRSLEHREERACLLDGHPTLASTGAWSDRSTPATVR